MENKLHILNMKHYPNILGDGISYLDHVDFSEANLNDHNRLMVITRVASICYQNPKALGSESLYNRLLSESQGLPSSSFEFVPMLLTKDEFDIAWENVNGLTIDREKGFTLNIEKYGEWILDGQYLLTNFRAAVYDKEEYNDLCDFTKRYNTEVECKIIKNNFNVFCVHADLPTFGQMVRHRANWQVLCISGNSKITTLQGTRTIQELYENQFRKSSDKLPKIRTYDFTEKRIVWSEIKEVFKSGKKPVYELVVQNDSGGNKSKIKSTEFHKFFTNDGWKELKDIKVGDFVARNIDNHTYKFGFVESITYIGEEETYDLEVDHPDHNYIANGLIVHNSRRYVSGERVPFEFYIAEKMKDVSIDLEFEVWYEKEDGSEDTTIARRSITTQDVINITIDHYKAALKKGIKPQVARGIIPQCAYTLAWVGFQPTQLENFFKLRCDSHAQWEIQQFAYKMQEAAKIGFQTIEISPERQEELYSRMEDYSKNGLDSCISKEEMCKILESKE